MLKHVLNIHDRDSCGPLLRDRTLWDRSLVLHEAVETSAETSEDEGRGKMQSGGRYVLEGLGFEREEE